MTPFIQVTWDAADGPIRHTVSSLGAAELEDEVPLPEPDPELQPAIASAAAAQAATAVILCRTAVVLLARLQLVCTGETNRKLSYKLEADPGCCRIETLVAAQRYVGGVRGHGRSDRVVRGARVEPGGRPGASAAWHA